MLHRRRLHGHRFVRACAVEMHMDRVQEPFLYGNLQENDRGHLQGHRFVQACAVEMHMDKVQAPFSMEIYRQNGRGHLRDNCFVRACAVEMHMDRVQEPFCVDIYGENDTRVAHGLRSRNAHGFVTRAILCGNLQGKCQTLPVRPRLNTGP